MGTAEEAISSTRMGNGGSSPKRKVPLFGEYVCTEKTALSPLWSKRVGTTWVTVK